MKQLWIQLFSPVWQGKCETTYQRPCPWLGICDVKTKGELLLIINTNVFKEQIFPTFVLLPYLNLDALSIDIWKEPSGWVVQHSLQSFFLPVVVCRGGAPGFSEEHGCRTEGNSHKLQQRKLLPGIEKKIVLWGW